MPRYRCRRNCRSSTLADVPSPSRSQRSRSARVDRLDELARCLGKELTLWRDAPTRCSTASAGPTWLLSRMPSPPVRGSASPYSWVLTSRPVFCDLLFTSCRLRKRARLRFRLAPLAPAFPVYVRSYGWAKGVLFSLVWTRSSRPSRRPRRKLARRRWCRWLTKSARWAGPWQRCGRPARPNATLLPNFTG
jgi:hypothetical protein